jgi:hypothetical protein
VETTKNLSLFFIGHQNCPNLYPPTGYQDFKNLSQAQCLTHVIMATLEAEIRRIAFKEYVNPISKIPNRNRAGEKAKMVEHLPRKQKTLSLETEYPTLSLLQAAPQSTGPIVCPIVKKWRDAGDIPCRQNH